MPLLSLDDLIHQVRLRLYLMLEMQEVAAPWMYGVYPEPIHTYHLDHYDSRPWPWWKYIYGDMRELPRALAYYSSEGEAQAHIARNPSHGPVYIRFERYRP